MQSGTKSGSLVLLNKSLSWSMRSQLYPKHKKNRKSLLALKRWSRKNKKQSQSKNRVKVGRLSTGYTT